ncbi:hypothetical protein [Pseudomonas atacamensis]|uniref:hypothetical protein n=1 Tax=Pseudomonas atacamensis TaxID=2565368 RepID=UPI00300ECC4D
MSDKMREEFEAAYKDACLKRPIPRFDAAVFAKDHCGDYLNPLVQSAWWAWQESRAALVVELPFDVTGGHYRLAVETCKRCIEAAGVKVAP